MNILFYNGKVFTELPGKTADAVYVEGNKIKCVGTLRNISSKILSHAESINLQGKMILPGFIDAHTHFVTYALSRKEVDLSDAQNLEEVKKKLCEFRDGAAQNLPWIKGIGWNKNIWPDAIGFNRYLLDEIFPNKPVSLFSKDLHTVLCNSKALDIMNILTKKPSLPGGRVGCFPDGRPDGFLYERASELVNQSIPPLSQESREKYLKEAIQEAHSFGLTGIHIMEDKAAYKLFSHLHEIGELTLRVCWHFPQKILDELLNMGIHSYTGDEWLKLGGVKLFIDGSLGSQSAYMYHPYPDSLDNYGTCIMSEEEVFEIMLKAGESGIATSTHAIGDRAVHILINAILRANKRLGRQMFHRVEHLQCVRPEDQIRVAQEHIYCSMQPIHISLDAEITEKFWGEYGRNSYPFRSLLQQQVHIGFGSDAPVATISPFLGIYSAIERKPRNNPKRKSWIPEEKITTDEAIRAYTYWSAYGSHSHKVRGTISEGKLADLIVVDDYTHENNIFWLEAKPYLTMVDGKIVYNRLS
ncbi:MAG: amidohydrolase [Candidatus Cloacimonadia bacterium]